MPNDNDNTLLVFDQHNGVNLAQLGAIAISHPSEKNSSSASSTQPHQPCDSWPGIACRARCLAWAAPRHGAMARLRALGFPSSPHPTTAPSNTRLGGRDTLQVALFCSVTKTRKWRQGAKGSPRKGYSMTIRRLGKRPGSGAWGEGRVEKERCRPVSRTRSPRFPSLSRLTSPQFHHHSFFVVDPTH